MTLQDLAQMVAAAMVVVSLAVLLTILISRMAESAELGKELEEDACWVDAEPMAARPTTIDG